MRWFAGPALVLGLLAGAGHAQPAPPPAGGDAVAHYEKGRRLYDLKEYDGAIAEFKAAYLADAAPGYLFNIAQAYRLKGDCTLAEDFFKKFLKADPQSDKRAKIEKLIRECVPAPEHPTSPTGTAGSTAGETGAAGGATGGGPAGDSAAGVDATRPEHPGPPVDAHPGRTRRIVGLATIGGGGVLLAVGTVLAINVAGIQADIERECGDADGCEWAAVRSRDSTARTRSTIAKVSVATGSVAVAAGIALWFWGRSADREVPVAIAPTAGGAVVSTGWSF